MAPTITIYTFDGTASYGGGYVGKLDSDEGGSYPQKLAFRLRSADPTTWRWFPVDYKPETALDGTLNGAKIDTLEANINRAISLAYADMQAQWAIDPDHKVVLSGLSQGTFITGVLFHEFRAGALSPKWNNLINVTNFGDACRPTGWTIPSSFFGGTVIDPGGHGAMAYPVRLPLSNTWSGSARLQGLHPNPASLTITTPHMGTIPKYLSFSNLADSASTVLDNAQGLKQQKLARALLYGPPGAVDPPNTQTVYRSPNASDAAGGNRLFDGLVSTLIDLNPLDSIDVLVGLISAILTNAATPNSLWGYGAYLFKIDNPNQWIEQTMEFLWPFLAAPGNWLSLPNPYGINMVQQWSPFIAGIVGGADVVNPHARYNEPYAYTGMTSNTKSAVQLAFEYVYKLGLGYSASAAWSPTLRTA